MRRIKVEMNYIGGVLSENHYRGRRRDGMLYVRREVRDWMEELGGKIKTAHIEDWGLPLLVRCDGHFKNTHRQPDLSNLSKVILDAIEETTGVNDRFMRWQDGEVSYGEPALLTITITEAK